ncbi:PAS domain-containing sensor histidine kinase [candidate division KSB1 bacterium]
MQLFIFWILVISLFIGGYSFFLWKKSKRGFRFRARITIIFLLLTLIPIVPITLLLSGTLSKSLDALISEDIETCLNTSIDIIRSEIDRRGTLLLNLYGNGVINVKNLPEILKNEIEAIREVTKTNNSLSFSNIYTKNVNLTESFPRISLSEFEDLKQGEYANSLFTVNEIDYISIYKKNSTEKSLNLIFLVPGEVHDAVKLIEDNKNAYSPLYQLKESLIEDNFIWALGVIFIFTIAFVAVLTARSLSKNVTNPLFSLVHGFERVKDGDLETRVEVKATDEIEYLIDSFNKMVEELKINREKLVYAEKIAAWRDVARSISHEIKNPLTPISLSLSRIQKKINAEKKDTAFYRECFSTIEEEIESLRKLATEFSEFARLPKPHFKNENLNEIVKNVQTMYKFNEKGISIEIELDENIGMLSFDKDQIRRVLINLIGNAMDASDTGSLIIIKTYSIGAEVYLETIDTGSGIKEELLKDVFEPYFTTKSRGTGLGLPIVKRIIDEHNGEIEIISEESKGTTFKIKFREL